MTRIVFDTNVLLSAVISERGTSSKLVLLAAQGKISGFTSIAILREFGGVAIRDYQFSNARVEWIVGGFLNYLELVNPDFTLDVLSDKPDNRVLECAVACKADYIASWDRHLTDLKNYQGIAIANPGKILDALTEGKN